MSQPLVSIITPVYNAERFIEDTIISVQAQTYENWELILIDDKSIDSSVEIIKKFQKNDNRIKLIESRENSGAAKSRNKGMAVSNGRFLTFLDADDTWASNKLTKQIKFMLDQSVYFSFTGYTFSGDDIKSEKVRVDTPEKVDLKYYLKNNIISTCGVAIDLESISKHDCQMPERSYGEDALTWINLLSKYGPAYGINEPLFTYRRTAGSVSANKLRSVGRKISLYWQVECLAWYQKPFYIISSLISALKKRV